MARTSLKAQFPLDDRLCVVNTPRGDVAACRPSSIAAISEAFENAEGDMVRKVELRSGAFLLVADTAANRKILGIYQPGR